MWRDCLEEAKLECHVTHLLDNLFLSKLNNLRGSITEVLATVVECGNRGEQVEQGACIHSLLSLLMMLQVNGPKTKYIWQMLRPCPTPDLIRLLQSHRSSATLLRLLTTYSGRARADTFPLSTSLGLCSIPSLPHLAVYPALT